MNENVKTKPTVLIKACALFMACAGIAAQCASAAPLEGFSCVWAESEESAAIRLESRDMSLVAPRVISGEAIIAASDGGTPAQYDTAALSDGWHTFSDAANGSDRSISLLTLNSGYAVEGGRLAGDVRWGPDKIHWVRNAVIVPNEATLTVEEGTIVKFGEGAYIRVEDGGTVNFAGTQENHVILTHFADYVYGGDSGFGASDVAWDSWSVTAQSGGIILDSCTEPRYGVLGPLPTLSMTPEVVATRSSGRVRIPVTLDRESSKPVALTWAAVDGTAQHGVDYTVSTGKLVFAAGETTEFIDIPLVMRDNIEELHSFRVCAVTVEGVNISPAGIATDVIVARGAKAAPVAVCAESESSPAIRVETRDPNPVPSPIPDDMEIFGGRLAEDMVWGDGVATNLVANTIIIPNGVTLTVATNATVFFTPHTGIKIEDGGSLRVIGSPEQPALLTAASDGDWSFTLLDGGSLYDAYGIFDKTTVAAHPTVSLPGGCEISERNERVRIPVSVTGGRTTPFRVRWRVVGGTATFGEDYTLADGEIEWSSSSDEAKYVTIPVPNDGVLEDSETMIVELYYGEGVNIGVGSRCTVLVRDGTDAIFPNAVCAESDASAEIRLETREPDPLPDPLPATWVVEGGRLAEDTVWGMDEGVATNFVLNTIVVPSGVTLTVVTNGTVFFAPHTVIKIEQGGTLRTIGSQEQPVVFAAENDGDYGITIVSGGTFTDMWTSFRNLQYGGFGTARIDGKLIVNSDEGMIRVPVYVSGSRTATFSVDWVASDGTTGTLVWNNTNEGIKWIELPITDARREGFSISLVEGRGINVSPTAHDIAVQVFRSSLELPVCAESASSEEVRMECRADGTLAKALVFGEEYVSGDGESSAAKWDSRNVADGWMENGILVRNDPSFAIECGRLPDGENVWGADKVHVVRSWVIVPSGSSLTIEAGAVVKFCELTGIKVEQGASFVVAGTEERPVVYTSAADDTIGGDSDLREANPAWGDYSLNIVSGGTYTDSNCAIRYVTLPNYGTTSMPAEAIAAETIGLVRIPVFISTDRNSKFCVDWRVRGAGPYAASGRVNWDNKNGGTKFIDLPLTRGTVTDGFDTFTVELYESQGINVSTTARTCDVMIYADDRFPDCEYADSAESVPVRFETREYFTDLEIGAAAGLVIEGGRLAGDTTWGDDVTHLVRNWVVVPSGVTLTIDAGTVVKFLPFTGIKVEQGGRVVADGTIARNIVFTSVADDSVGGDTDGRAVAPVHGNYTVTVVSGGSLSTSETQLRYGTSGTFGTVSITAAAVASRATGYVRIPVTVNTASPEAFSVDWRVIAGDAVCVDAAAYGRIDWPAGSTAMKFIDIPLNGMAPFVANEAFDVELCISRGVGLNLAATTCGVTLYDTINTFTGGDDGVRQSDWAPFTKLDAAVADPQYTPFAVSPEQVAYSARWEDGARTVRLHVDGAETLREGAGEGVFSWNAAALTPGRYVLRHDSLDATGEILASEAREFIVSDAILHDHYVSGDEKWEGGRVHIVRGDVALLDGASLEIGRGAIVKFLPGSRLATFGDSVCIARGVTFTHISDDDVGGDALFDGDASLPVDGEYTLSGNIVTSVTTVIRYANAAEVVVEPDDVPDIDVGVEGTVEAVSGGYVVTASGDETIDSSNVHIYAVVDGEIVDTKDGWNIVTDGGTALVTLKAPFENPKEDVEDDAPWSENDDGTVTLNVSVVPGLYYATAAGDDLSALACPGASAPARKGDSLVLEKVDSSSSRGFYRVWVSPSPIAPAQE